jgi:hypothetical protein
LQEAPHEAGLLVFCGVDPVSWTPHRWGGNEGPRCRRAISRNCPEFRQRIVESIGKGRTPEELARQFEPSAQAIRNWVKQAAFDTPLGLEIIKRGNPS